MTSLRSSSDTPQRIEEALDFIAAERLVLGPDCGMKYLPRDLAFAKLRALAAGAAIARSGLP
jgi:5-methyltetrahydropteroyltriglutamate--homocysteine methyltransferase